MKKEIIQLDIAEYLAYILLYAANADFDMAKEEMDIIRDSVSREDFTRIRKDFDECNDGERLAVIMHYRDAYINVLADYPTVVSQLKALFEADERYSVIERSVFMLLKKLLKV